MNPPLTTLDPVPTPAHAKTILSQDGFKCSLLTLAPGAEMPRADSEHSNEQVLFVVEGEVTIQFDTVNTILTKNKALLIPKGKSHTITANPGREAKLLRTEIPPREVVMPPLVSLER